MEWLQSLLESGTTPPLTAFLLGLLTALSPCPLATNIAAIGFIGKEIGDRRRIFRNGLLYTLGRTLSYTLLGIVLILILKEGSSMFGIQKAIGKHLFKPCLDSGMQPLSVRGQQPHRQRLHRRSANTLCMEGRDRPARHFPDLQSAPDALAVVGR